MRSRVMVVGPVDAGKTTLLNALDLVPKIRKKTPAIMFSGDSIDTPGEVFEIPGLYHTIIQTSSKASLVLLVADPVRPKSFPAGFLKSFRTVAWGVVSKTDRATEHQVARARAALLEAGVEEVFSVSALSGEGIDELKARISTILGRCSVHER